MPQRITEIYAWVAEDVEGEGIPAFLGPNDIMMPLVMADKGRVDDVRLIAERLQKQAGVPFKLVRFYGLEIVEYLGEKQ